MLEGQSARLSALQRVMQEEARRPFALSSDPMLRALLVKLSSTEHRLMLTLHHIASDGWSTGILLRELMAAYTGLLAGQPVALYLNLMFA